MTTLAFIGSIGFGEMVLIGIIGLLVFGSRLPNVGRKLGRRLMEFKKGLLGLKDEMDDAMSEADAAAERKALEAEQASKKKDEQSQQQAQPAEVPPVDAGAAAPTVSSSAPPTADPTVAKV